jgi:hypothetical protein
MINWRDPNTYAASALELVGLLPALILTQHVVVWAGPVFYFAWLVAVESWDAKRINAKTGSDLQLAGWVWAKRLYRGLREKP